MGGMQTVFRILEAVGALGVAVGLVYLRRVRARGQNLKRDQRAGVRTLFDGQK